MYALRSSSAAYAYLAASESLRDNAEQWNAYQATGNAVVLAGPGSGKTKTLTIKMARTLAEDVPPPRGVACITYSAECARELGRRLVDLGVEPERRVFVGTLHGFCLSQILMPFAELAGRALPEPLVVASNEERRVALRRAFEEASQDWSRPAEQAFHEFRLTRVDRNAEPWKDRTDWRARVVRRYETLLREGGRIDFDDMALMGLDLVRGHDWIVRALRAKFPVLFIDEYQDLGVALHELARHLCRRGGIRLFAVGDPDQSIYGFQYAQPQLLEDLAEQLGSTPIRLRLNYRCGNRIISAASAALAEERRYESRAAEAGLVFGKKCEEGLSQQAEVVFAEIIPAATQRHPATQPGDIAVLYRNAGQGSVVADIAERYNQKVVRIDRDAPYRKAVVTRWLEDCAEWCRGGWEQAKPRLSVLIESLRGLFPAADGDDAIALRSRVISFLFTHRDPGMLLSDWLSEFRRVALDQALDQWSRSPDLSEPFRDLCQASAAGHALARWDVATFAGQGGKPDHLNLITLHSAKGREFDVVIILGLEEGLLPTYQVKERPELLPEERRLFYVGLTRAKREVHLLYSGWYLDPYGGRRSNGISRFVREVRRGLQD